MNYAVLAFVAADAAEKAAIAASAWRGKGDKNAADQAAVDAMRTSLGKAPFRGTVVIGEGDLDEAPMLHIGEIVGDVNGVPIDIAVDPLEGTALCAKNLPNALTVIALGQAGTLFAAPDTYMEKIAIGAGYPDGVVDLDWSLTDNVKSLAHAKGVSIPNIGVCILDKPRHAALIEEARRIGVKIHAISDGDVAGVFAVTDAARSGVDMYVGIGGAPEGVLSAAALRCVGGFMQARLHPMSNDEQRRIAAMKISDVKRKLMLSDLVKGDVVFAATGVTGGTMFGGIDIVDGVARSDTLVLSSFDGRSRRISSAVRV
jgi:fructose-1,6-bisphosphatase II / sedoheptulose-1,7-bisphosphatase